jgi:hypothetical protein
MSKPVIVRLISGEELIAVVNGDTSRGPIPTSTYTLSKPMFIAPQRDPKTQQIGIALLPFPRFASKKATDATVLYGTSIMYFAEIDEQLLPSYTQLTSNLIVPQQAGSLLLG